MEEVQTISRFFESRLVVPRWWVKAYDIVASRRATYLSALEIAFSGGIAPALMATELSALASIVTDLQRQILEGRQRLSLDPDDHKKHASVSSRVKAFSFERILQLLSGLRILREDVQSGYCAYPLFSGETWQRTADAGVRLELELAPLGKELILGVPDAYSELVRHFKGAPLAEDLLTEAPLVVWRSLWLDLGGLEQGLVLRLERAMQWEFRWLDCEGVFGLGLDELFGDCELPRAGIYAGQSEFAIRSAILSRLGRSLVGHGLMTPRIPTRYLALTNREAQGPVAVWQISRARLEAQDSAFYLGHCATYYLRSAYQRALPEIRDLLLPPAILSLVHDRFARVWGEVFEVAIEADRKPAYVMRDASLVLGAILFCEWWARQLPTHPLPLPGEIARTKGGILCNPSQDDGIRERFREFAAWLGQDFASSLCSLDLPLATLTSRASRGTPEFKELLKIYRDSATPKQRDTLEVKARPNETMVRTEADSSKLRPKTEGGFESTKRQATAELLRLRDRDPQGYTSLKKMYIESLDLNRKKIVLEMQSRSQSQSFDDYLRHSLVKFMVENPDAWQGPVLIPRQY